MSKTATRRDIADPKTIQDFVRLVQSPERLRLLIILTVVDIRAVGPGVWNEWKAVLLRALFEAAEERLRLGHKERGRVELVKARKEELAGTLGWNPKIVRAFTERLADSYWLAEPPDVQAANALQVAKAEARMGEAIPTVVAETDPESGFTRVSVFTPDREALFYRIAAGLAAAGATIMDARIHTTRDGMALDNLLVQDGQGKAFTEKRARARLVKAVESALSSEELPPLAEPPAVAARKAAFPVPPRVVVAEHASTRTTVVEVNARDRPGLLARLSRAIHSTGEKIHSAHIATYGERAVDVFYLTGPDGQKLKPKAIEKLRTALLDAARAAG
jgi:[protein-PII] uridylyltransferase